mmetsp:Transcript_84547/g.182252  ORF Transcript_84547/g.182252 Transcript_84547/m.182252 type:complete len:112 (+) Transcript_84547:195-530(+)
MPVFGMIIKNNKKTFSFEIQVKDHKGTNRRFRCSSNLSTTKVKPFVATIPVKIEDGWNHLSLNLAEYTQNCFNSQMVEVVGIKLYANCFIRRVYFCNKVLSEDELIKMNGQ